MATYYVDPAATGLNNGTSWTNAWTSFQSALTNAVAGDTVYCRGSQQITSGVSTVNAGSEAAGYIKYIGCNASGVVDGTKFRMYGATGDGVAHNADDFLWWENIQVDSCGGDGWDPVLGANFCVWYNCVSASNSGNGWAGGNANSYYFFCLADSNSLDGWSGVVADARFIGCMAIDNGDYGITGSGANCILIECISHDNGGTAGDAGYYFTGARALYQHCIADGEYYGIRAGNVQHFSLMNRVTNNVIGNRFESASNLSIYGFTLYEGNTANTSVLGTDVVVMRNASDSDTRILGTDTDDGYNDRTNEDFNLKRDRSYNGDGRDASNGNSGVILLGIGS
jgi:hypothetical protein